MKRLVRFAAALMAVLTLTACTAEVGTSSVTSTPMSTTTSTSTSNPLPSVTTEPGKEDLELTEQKLDSLLALKDFLESQKEK